MVHTVPFNMKQIALNPNKKYFEVFPYEILYLLTKRSLYIHVAFPALQADNVTKIELTFYVVTGNPKPYIHVPVYIIDRAQVAQ